MDELDNRINRLEKLAKEGSRGVSSASHITVNAGGIGVYIAVTCCAVMLAVNIFLIAIIVNHERKIDDLGDYIHAIYMISGNKQEKPK